MMEDDGRRIRILLTRKLPEEGVARLFREAKVDLWEEDRAMPREEFLKRIRGKDGVICLLSEKIDREVLDSGIKAVGNYAVGYDNIDVAEATDRGIPVFNTPGVLTDATADIAFALLLGAARKIVPCDRYVRSGEFKGWSPMNFLGKDLTGSILGVIGAGKIGQAVMRRGKGFGMNIVYNSRKRKEDVERDMGARYMDLDELLGISDFVSLNVPLTEETRHLISEREFRIMKNDSILINTARGPVIDEKALYSALKDGEIGGAGLDVFEEEPKVYPPLTTLDNVVMLPHVGSATTRTRIRMAEMVSADILDYLKGGKPANCVNPEVLKGD
ncbi:MAG: 2-hydroxyacid dehydrogenase [Thermoplasmatota archaeon]